MEVGKLRLYSSAGGFMQGTCWRLWGQGLTCCSCMQLACIEGGMGKGCRGLPLPTAVVPLDTEPGQ